MLPPDPHAIWLVSFLLVIATRDFAIPFVPFAVISQALIWMTSDANQLTGTDTFNFVVRRSSYAVYGAVAGYVVAAALGTRVLVPLHSFVNKRIHWAGPIMLLSVSYGTYALATAVGLTQAFLPFGDEPWDSAGYQVLFWAIFGVMAILAGSVLWTSWRGITECPMALRYRDGGLPLKKSKEMAHSVSRFAAEAVITLALLIAPHFIWIFATLGGWPQYGGGLIALGVVAIFWIVLWRAAMDRHTMEMTYFHVDESRVSWTAFCVVVGGLHFASMLAYIIVAAFTSTALAAEVTLIVTTLAACVAAFFAWLFLTSAFTARPPRRSNIVAPCRQSLTTAADGSLEVAGAAGYDSASSIEERRRRVNDLGLM